MPYPSTWDEVLEAPAFVINLKRRPDRWLNVCKNIAEAGFKNIQRFEAIDCQDSEQCEKAYTYIGRPPRHPSFNNDFTLYPGTYGVFLSQTSLWKKMVDEDIPYACIFEDDVIFHSMWHDIAHQYFKQTPQEYDILFMGSQFEFNAKYHVDKGAVFCLHAYIITKEGAKTLLDYVTSTEAGGIYTIDTMLKVSMEKYKPAFKWYVWNGSFFPCTRSNMTSVWKKRNNGLVFQDEKSGTDIRVYSS